MAQKIDNMAGSIVKKVASLAGRRPDPLNSDIKRFPLANTDAVQNALYETFAEQSFTALVCSAACGADLLALEVAAKLNVEATVFLPFAPQLFRELSVVDRPGDWGPLFDRIIEDVQSKGGVHNLNYSTDDPDAFSKTNKAMVAHAKTLAANSRAYGILVWDGHPREEDDATQEFGMLCKKAGFSRIEISTL